MAFRYVEWEKYPEKKQLAQNILASHKFSPIPGALFAQLSTRIGQPLAHSLIEFQFVPLPDTNPVLIGHRWKEYHEALGLKQIWMAFQSVHLLPTPPPTPSQPLQFDNPFLINYVVYHHYRSLGWVVKGGIKFCVDYLLYKRGPVFAHAECVL